LNLASRNSITIRQWYVGSAFTGNMIYGPKAMHFLVELQTFIVGYNMELLPSN